MFRNKKRVGLFLLTLSKNKIAKYPKPKKGVTTATIIHTTLLGFHTNKYV